MAQNLLYIRELLEGNGAFYLPRGKGKGAVDLSRRKQPLQAAETAIKARRFVP